MNANAGERVSSKLSRIFKGKLWPCGLLTLLLAYHAIHSPIPNSLDGLKDLLDEVYSGDAVEEQVRDKIDEIIGDANTLLKSTKVSSR